MSESQKKSARSFQCRDALWEKFEEMAKDLECSVDYLINDAMKQYARQRGLNSAATTGAPPSSISASPGPMSARAAASPKPAPLPTVSVPAAMPPLPVPAPGPLPPLPSRGPSRSPLPSLPQTGMAPPPPIGAASALAVGPATLPISPSRVPPPPPGAAVRPPAPPPPRAGKIATPGSSLTVYYEGTAYPVMKESFIIGRGKQVSDLTIRDPNISRQHAVIEFSGGSFWMVDLNSTNGVEFNGQRVGRRAIQNGEVYRICSHELLMSLS
jgi:FHA domain